MAKKKTSNGYSAPNVIAICGIAVAIIYGTWGIIISYSSLKTSVDIGHFNDLLTKTDTVISNNVDLIKSSTKQIGELQKVNEKFNIEIDKLSFLQQNELVYEKANLNFEWNDVDGVSSYAENSIPSIYIFNYGKRPAKKCNLTILPLSISNKKRNEYLISINDIQKFHQRTLNPSIRKKIPYIDNDRIHFIYVVMSYKDDLLPNSYYVINYYVATKYNNTKLYLECNESEISIIRSVIEKNKRYKYLLKKLENN